MKALISYKHQILLPLLLTWLCSFIFCILAEDSCCEQYKNDQCSKCNDTCVLMNSSCEFNCSSNYYREDWSGPYESSTITANQTCQSCNDECNECYGKSSRECYACKRVKHFSNTNGTGPFECLHKCPAQYFADRFNICKRCNIEACSLCKEIKTMSKANFTDCQKECPGYYAGIPYSSSRNVTQCETCFGAKNLILTVKDLDSCTCCVSNCPPYYKNILNTCQWEGEKKWCAFENCEPIISGSLGGVVFLVIVLIICCCVCKKRESQEKPKTPPSVTQLQTLPDSKPQRSQEEDTNSHDSTTGVPLLPTQRSSHGYVNVSKNPPPLPKLRPEPPLQEDYENVVNNGHVQQEIYENESFAPKPALPPRKGSKKDDDLPDYENEASIEELKASNPHLKNAGLSLRKEDSNKLLPLPKGHVVGKKKPYVNQDVVDQQTDTPSTVYANTTPSVNNNSQNILTEEVPPPTVNTETSAPYYNVAGPNYYNQR